MIPFALLCAWKILDYIHAAVAAELDQVAAAEHKATIVATGRRLGQVVLQLAGICHSIQCSQAVLPIKKRDSRHKLLLVELSDFVRFVSPYTKGRFTGGGVLMLHNTPLTCFFLFIQHMNLPLLFRDSFRFALCLEDP